VEEPATAVACVWDGGSTLNSNDHVPRTGWATCTPGRRRLQSPARADQQQNDFQSSTLSIPSSSPLNGFFVVENNLTLDGRITVDSGVTGSTIGLGIGLGGSVMVMSLTPA